MKSAVRVESGRAAVDALRVEGVQPDDIVEIELEDGLRLWSRVDDLERDFGLPRSRGAVEGVIEMPARLVIGPPTRGWATWGIKALKVVGIDVTKSIADFAASPGPLRAGKPNRKTLGLRTASPLRHVSGPMLPIRTRHPAAGGIPPASRRRSRALALGRTEPCACSRPRE